MGKMLLVVVDAHSKWPEVYIMNSTTSTRTITALRDIFARFGLPKQLVSDNGPQFVSEEFEQFLVVNGINHIRSSPYHPSTNGAAERVVQTVKKALKAGCREGLTLEHILATFLLQYCTTPHATTGRPPSSLLLGRQLRTRLDLLSPTVQDRVERQQAKQKEHHDRHSRYRELSVNQPVWVRNFRDAHRWLQGVVIDRVGPLIPCAAVRWKCVAEAHRPPTRQPGGDAISKTWRWPATATRLRVSGDRRPSTHAT